jgi:hypothetical protein
MESKPVFRRFWVKVLPDGRAMPQFDPFSGAEHLWHEYDGPLAQVLFLPMTPTLAEKLKQHGNRGGPSKLPQVVIDIPPGSTVHYERRGRAQFDLTKICGFCEAEFDPDLKECPLCLAKNQWYCSVCDTIKFEPLYVRNSTCNEECQRSCTGCPSAQVRCPECEAKEPHGLNTIHCLGEFYEGRNFFTTILDVDGTRHLIINY